MNKVLIEVSFCNFIQKRKKESKRRKEKVKGNKEIYWDRVNPS